MKVTISLEFEATIEVDVPEGDLCDNESAATIAARNHALGIQQEVIEAVAAQARSAFDFDYVDESTHVWLSGDPDAYVLIA